jgi:hypothetical protein
MVCVVGYTLRFQFIMSKNGHAFGLYLLQPFTLRAEQVKAPIAMQDGNASPELYEMRTHIFRQVIKTVILIRPIRQQDIIRVDEFLPVLHADLAQVADHPAFVLKIPVVCQPDEAVIGCDVGEEGELTAGGCAVLPLANRRSFACQQAEVGGCLSPDGLRIKRLSNALIPAPNVPEIGIRFQVSPLLVVGGWNRMTDITAKRDAVGVVGCTKLPAVKFCGWRIETAVKLAQIEHRRMHGLIVSGLFYVIDLITF